MGGRGGTPCATCAHTHARPAASRRPPGPPRSSFPQRERRAQPSWRTGPQYRHHHGGPGEGGDANEHSHRAWRGSPSGHRIRPMRHHSKPNMDGKSRGAVFCLAGRLGLGRGGGCGWLSCRRRPTGRGRAPGACAGGATKPPQPPSGGRCPRPGHRCGADVPSDRASARRSRGRRRSHPRDDARRRPSLKGIGCGSDLRAKGCGRGWSPKRPAQVVRGGPPAASSAARLTLGLTRSPENMIGGRRHLVFPCQA